MEKGLRGGDEALFKAQWSAQGYDKNLIYVLSRPYTYCGETNIERLALTF